MFQSPTAHEDASKREGWVWLSRERPAADFYRSPAWRAIRNAEIAANKQWYRRPTPTCERCGAHHPWFWEWQEKPFVFGLIKLRLPGRSEREWHGDHIKPRSLYPDLELDPDNVQILCSACNYAKGNRSEIDWKRLRRKPMGLGYPRIWWLRSYQRTVLGWSV